MKPDPILHCCETWHVLAKAGTVLMNTPVQQATWDAIHALQTNLLRPIQEHFGAVEITYGFADRELVKAVRKRAAEGGWLPNINPPTDQHAGHELNTLGQRICKRDGFAVDLRVPGESSEVVTQWVLENLPFDAIYRYGEKRPFHLSWAERPRGMVIRMLPKKNGGLYPKVEVKGRTWG